MRQGGWINPVHFRRCQGKQRFRTFAQAEPVAERASRKTGELILAYTCFDCGRIHIGHADRAQQLVREERSGPACRHCGELLPESKLQKGERFDTQALYCSDKCQRLAAKQRRRERIDAFPQWTEAESSLPD